MNHPKAYFYDNGTVQVRESDAERYYGCEEDGVLHILDLPNANTSHDSLEQALTTWWNGNPLIDDTLDAYSSTTNANYHAAGGTITTVQQKFRDATHDFLNACQLDQN